MNFEINSYHRDCLDEELIADLKNVASLIGKNTVTLEEYNDYGQFHSTTLTRRFGSWFKCLELAELSPSRSKIGISNEELFLEIERVWIKLGKQPSYSQMRDLSCYSVGTYEKRFNGWRNALKQFAEYINNINVSPDNEYLIKTKNLLNMQSPSKTRTSSTHKTSRTINTRLRFIVMKRDNFKCVCCGASPAKDTSVELHIDHIIPWSAGGETVIENLQTLCSKCNLGKSNLI